MKAKPTSAPEVLIFTPMKIGPTRRDAWGALRRVPVMPQIRRVEDLLDPLARPEHARQIARAKILFADYPQLERDFPELAELDPDPTRRHAAIDRWLLEHAAVMSETQLGSTDVSTPVEVKGPALTAHRPARYGRALVRSVAGARGFGLLDIKGAGVGPGAVPSRELHQNGLMQLGEAISDIVHQWLIDACLAHAGSEVGTLPCYALIDPGFDVYTIDGRRVPAGMQVRRAHRRPLFGIELPAPGSANELLKFRIEMLLRHYGLTSCNNGTLLQLRTDDQGRLYARYGEHDENSLETLEPWQRELLRRLARLDPGSRHEMRRFDGVNVQLTRREEGYPPVVLDFGHWGWRSHFDRAVLNLVRGRPLAWSGALWPDSPAFVQPIRALCARAELWPGARSWDLGRQVRDGEMTGRELRDAILDFIGANVERWPPVAAARSE